MFEHLFNCHGEWQALLALIDSWPMLGAWIRSRFPHEHKEDCDENR